MNNHYFKNLILVFIVGLFYLLNATDTSMVFGIDSEKYSFVSKIGSKGTSDGQFDTPHTIAFDSSGNMYVTDTKNARVQKFDNNGTFLTKWGSRGMGEGQFLEPEDIEIDSSNKVYVTDRGTASIQSFIKLH